MVAVEWLSVKNNAIAVWPIVLGVWHPVVFSDMKPRIIILLSRDSSGGKQIPFV
jgi:hypothetical protein